MTPTREDVVRLAQEAGVDMLPGPATTAFLERFYALAAAAEREACAQVCEDYFSSDGDWCAKAIRARGQA